MRGGSALIDVHVHLYPDEKTGRRLKEAYEIWEYGEDPGVEFDTTAGLIEDVGSSYEDAGFDHAVVLQLFDVATARTTAVERLQVGLSEDQLSNSAAALEEALAVALMNGNRWVVSATAANPKLTAYVCIDPVLLSRSEMDSHLREMAALGARGIKLHPVSQGYRPDDPRLDELYDLCCELGLVVLSHSGPGHHGGATARPSEFADVIRRRPDLRLVLAHLGGAAWEEAADLAEAFPQIVFDISEIVEWTGAPNAPSRSDLADVVRRIGADRIMLGSDFPWYEPTATADKVDSLPGLGRAERAALLGETALGVLGLELDPT